MDVREVREKKLQAEKDIRAVMEKFTEETGCQIANLKTCVDSVDKNPMKTRLLPVLIVYL